MDSVSVSAIISAAAGICGVLLGNSLTAFKEWAMLRSSRRKDTAYLAIVVVSHLDRFSNSCLRVAYDDGTSMGRPAGADGVVCVATEPEPVFAPLDLDVEWRVLPETLMYPILRIPDRCIHLSNTLSRMDDDSDFPEYTAYFRARRLGYANLGLEASELAWRLREHARMPIEEAVRGEWSREAELRAILERLQREEEEVARRRAAYIRGAHEAEPLWRRA